MYCAFGLETEIVTAVCFPCGVFVNGFACGFGFRDGNLGAIACWPFWFHLSVIICKADEIYCESRKDLLSLFLSLAQQIRPYCTVTKCNLIIPSKYAYDFWNFHDDDGGDKDWHASTMAFQLLSFSHSLKCHTFLVRSGQAE